MPVVKRYPNRKLYDTEAKQYITLEGITELIRAGEDVQVIDHTSGNDLTALTLTQIIYEEEKKKSGLLPLPTLTGLIRTSGDRLTSIQKNLFTSTFWRQIDEEIRSRVRTLVDRKELSRQDGINLLEKLLQPDVRSHAGVADDKDSVQISSQELEAYLVERQLPTREDLNQLYSQLEELAQKIENVKKEDGDASF